jgi:NAD(P)-dependent dehydrogenase (short-subunit alcohol dehydrogenase family)
LTLNQRHILVTGGSRGIGFEICKRFLSEGARVLAVSRNADKLAAARESLPNLEVLAGDMSVPADIDRAVSWVRERWGRLDVLINNAGILPSGEGSLVSQADDVFAEVMRVNLTGANLCTKRFLPLLEASDDPRVVNLGSTSGIMAPGLSGVYAISKAALHALTVAWSNELTGKMPVNAMSPGWVRTDMSPNAPGDPSDSAETALWLVTQPRTLTGQFIRDKSAVGWMPLEIVEQVAQLNREINL